MTAPRPAGHVLVLLDGDPPTRAGLDAVWPGWDRGAGHVVAADGGARLADGLGLHIDEWVGDGDSLGADGVEALRRAGVRVELVAAAKEETDAELALLAALRVPGVRRITVLGALGGPRVDHEVANLGLLAHPALLDLSITILGPGARIRCLGAPGPDGGPARLDLAGRIGDIVSLLPVGDVAGVTTTGLRFPLRDEDLPMGPARGVSNVRDAAGATVTLRAGRLLVVEVPATLPE